MNESYQKYRRRWQDVVLEANKAMSENNFDKVEECLNEAKRAFEKYKSCCKLPEANKKRSFGELNCMFEQKLPKLLKKNKGLVKECRDFIKSDSNLISEFKFIDALRNFDMDGSALEYVKESLNLASNGIDKKTLSDSNDKLAEFMSKAEVGFGNMNEEEQSFYQACDKLLSEDKSLSNLNEYTNALNEVSAYVEKQRTKTSVLRNIKKIEESFYKKYNLLNEEESALVKDIIDFKRPQVEERKKKLFDTYKNECVKQVDRLIYGTSNISEKTGYENVKSLIENMQYNPETIVKDLAKLMETRETLMEN